MRKEDFTKKQAGWYSNSHLMLRQLLLHLFSYLSRRSASKTSNPEIYKSRKVTTHIHKRHDPRSCQHPYPTGPSSSEFKVTIFESPFSSRAWIVSNIAALLSLELKHCADAFKLDGRSVEAYEIDDFRMGRPMGRRDCVRKQNVRNSRQFP